MTKMKAMSKQYMMSVYDDGSIKLTERALTKRDKQGRFKAKRHPWRGEGVCRFASERLRG